MHRTANPLTPVRFRSWPPFHEPAGTRAAEIKTKRTVRAVNQGIGRRKFLFISAGIDMKYIALIFLEVAACDTVSDHEAGAHGKRLRNLTVANVMRR